LVGPAIQSDSGIDRPNQGGRSAIRIKEICAGLPRVVHHHQSDLVPSGDGFKPGKLRVTEFPWISTPVAVLSHDNRIPKKPEVMVTAVKNGKCRFTVNPAGHFDLKLLDIAGRAVYHLNAMGPTSFMVNRGLVHNGTYVAHIVAGGKKFEKKILIVQ
jgi:hypothetical protein